MSNTRRYFLQQMAEVASLQLRLLPARVINVTAASWARPSYRARDCGMCSGMCKASHASSEVDSGRCEPGHVPTFTNACASSCSSSRGGRSQYVR